MGWPANSLVAVIVVVVAVVAIGLAKDPLKYCKKISQCACRDNTGKILRVDGGYFPDMMWGALNPFKPQVMYVVSPCISLDYYHQGPCTNLGAGKRDGPNCYALGHANSSYFKVKDGHLNLVFESPSGNASMTLQLGCMPDGATLTFVSEVKENHVILNLTTMNLCRFHDWVG